MFPRKWTQSENRRTQNPNLLKSKKRRKKDTVAYGYQRSLKRETREKSEWRITRSRSKECPEGCFNVLTQISRQSKKSLLGHSRRWELVIAKLNFVRIAEGVETFNETKLWNKSLETRSFNCRIVRSIHSMLNLAWLGCISRPVIGLGSVFSLQYLFNICS